MKCENCNQEGFDALITLAGTSKLFADGWCLDCLKKWSYANKHIKLDKPKIEYQCYECGKSLYPQNGVTYVYHLTGIEYEKDGGHFWNDFMCRDHAEEKMRQKQTGDFDYKDLIITRYTRQMHLEALQKLEQKEQQ